MYANQSPEYHLMIILIPLKHVKKTILFLIKAKVMKYYLLDADMANLFRESTDDCSLGHTDLRYVYALAQFTCRSTIVFAMT